MVLTYNKIKREKEMGWMAEALHRSIGNWMAEALHRFQNETESCMKSKRGPDCKTLRGSHMS